MGKWKSLKQNKYFTAISKYVVWFFPVVFFYLMECYTANRSWGVLRVWAQVFNILLFFLITAILFFITGRLRLSLRILGGVSCVYGLLNAYIMRFRTNPIVPWDFFSIRTAVSVADNYDFTPTIRMVCVTLCFLVLLIALQLVDIRLNRLAVWIRLAIAVVFVVVLVQFAKVLQQESFQNKYRLYNKLFGPVNMVKRNGVAVNFVMNMAFVFIDKPEGYVKEEAGNLLAEYETSQNADAGGGQLPNIIVIMDEAFSDPAVLGEFETNQDYMPFIHSMQQGGGNTVTGLLNISVCGGNTANTEFEFLTGNTLAFLPQGSVPYQQYVKREMPSMASHLKDLGYDTIAIHPFKKGGWDRDQVYPRLGFDTSIFQEDFEGEEVIRKFYSDAACFRKIISLYENKTPGQPFFVYNVTMQNHGLYNEKYDNFTPDIDVEGINDLSVEQYLSLMKVTDAALRDMVDYFADQDEKTVIVFFGDHQPNDKVASPILNMNGKKVSSLSESELQERYKVPFLIWANYDIEKGSDVDISVNYLGAEVLKRSGVPTYNYQNFLLEMEEKYPVVTPMRLKRGDGSETFIDEEEQGLSAYKILQYYQIFEG